MASEAFRRFASLAARREADVDLAEAALWIAAEGRPQLDVRRELARLDDLARRASRPVEAAAGERGRIEALNRFLFVEEDFRGNRDDYYDPRNSFLDQVLERRLGIPITLSIVYVEVAQRLGLHAVGVGFPGHFLSKVVGAEEVLVDAFEGRIVSRDECGERLRALAGPEAVVDRTLLRPAPPRQILARMLTNLKQIHVDRKDWEPALACCDRLLVLAPDAPLELRDRGLLYRQLECHRAALTDLERFLALAPDHASAAPVRRVLPALREQARRLH